MLSAKTGDVSSFESEGVIASDVGSSSSQGTSIEPVGRTMYDIIHERAISIALGKFISATDPIEVLAVGAYVIVKVFGKSGEPVIRFWLLVTLLTAYHLVLKPFAEWIRFRFSDPKQLPKPPLDFP
jgi:hypothetical protein